LNEGDNKAQYQNKMFQKSTWIKEVYINSPNAFNLGQSYVFLSSGMIIFDIVPNEAS